MAIVPCAALAWDAGSSSPRCTARSRLWTFPFFPFSRICQAAPSPSWLSTASFIVVHADVDSLFQTVLLLLHGFSASCHLIFSLTLSCFWFCGGGKREPVTTSKHRKQNRRSCAIYPSPVWLWASSIFPCACSTSSGTKTRNGGRGTRWLPVGFGLPGGRVARHRCLSRLWIPPVPDIPGLSQGLVGYLFVLILFFPRYRRLLPQEAYCYPEERLGIGRWVLSMRSGPRLCWDFGERPGEARKCRRTGAAFEWWCSWVAWWDCLCYFWWCLSFPERRFSKHTHLLLDGPFACRRP